ncbi:MAG: GH74, partial [uncultured Thermomicrobiales bacterium]
ASARREPPSDLADNATGRRRPRLRDVALLRRRRALPQRPRVGAVVLPGRRRDLATGFRTGGWPRHRHVGGGLFAPLRRGSDRLRGGARGGPPVAGRGATVAGDGATVPAAARLLPGRLAQLRGGRPPPRRHLGGRRPPIDGPRGDVAAVELRPARPVRPRARRRPRLRPRRGALRRDGNGTFRQRERRAILAGDAVPRRRRARAGARDLPDVRGRWRPLGRHRTVRSLALGRPGSRLATGRSRDHRRAGRRHRLAVGPRGRRGRARDLTHGGDDLARRRQKLGHRAGSAGRPWGHRVGRLPFGGRGRVGAARRAARRRGRARDARRV